jgi:hypothetical protein
LGIGLFYIFGAGGAHVDLWVVYFLVIYFTILDWRKLRIIGQGIGIFILLGIPKLYWMAKIYGAYHPASLHGFLTFSEVWSAFFNPKISWFEGRHFKGDYHSVERWETHAYLGITMILMPLVVFFNGIRNRSLNRFQCAALITLSLLLVFMFNENYFYIRKLPIPGVQSQRHTTRFVVLVAFSVCLLIADSVNQLAKRVPNVFLVLTLIQFLDLRVRQNQWLKYDVAGNLPIQEIVEETKTRFFRTTYYFEELDGAKSSVRIGKVDGSNLEIDPSDAAKWVVFPDIRDRLILKSSPLEYFRFWTLPGQNIIRVEPVNK